MTEVEAHLFYWTPQGMCENPPHPGPRQLTAYVERGEVERLLAEAHTRGLQQGHDRVTCGHE